MKHTNKLLLALALSSLSISSFAGDLPNSKLTPGATSAAVTQQNIHETICVKGYTKTVRPPQNYTNSLKKHQIKEYQYEDTNPKDYEEDHLIPLSIGGNPADERNLWPQPRNSAFGADHKDELELKLQNMVCHGDIPLAEAQHAISTNWIDAYKKYGGEKYHGGNSGSHESSNSYSPTNYATHTMENMMIKHALKSLF